MACEVCGSKTGTGCRPVHYHLAALDLTPDEWREVYHFMRFVFYPFMHQMAARAAARNKGFSFRTLRQRKTDESNQ